MQKKKSAGSELVTNDYLDIRLDELRDEVKDMITQTHSKLYTRIDPLLKEIVDNREDREIGTQKVRDLEIRLNSHDRRIKKLETS